MSLPVEERSVSPRIGEWLSTAFNLFGQAWQVWVVHGLMALVIPVLTGSVAAFAGFALGIMAVVNRPEGDPQGLLIMAASIVGMVIATVVPFLYLGAGMIQTAARQLRGETIAVRDILVPFGSVVRLSGAFLIIALLQIVGAFLCIIPALIASGLFLYAPPLIVDRGLGVIEALATSVRMTRSYLLLYILWSMLIGIIYHAGGVIAIGYAATLPISVLMLMVGYREAIGEAPLLEQPAPYNPLYR